MHPLFSSVIDKIARLPGLGPRSARRILMHFMKHQHNLLYPFIQELDRLSKSIKTCPVCHNMDIVAPCDICTNRQRFQHQLCIVADINDLWAIEKTGIYSGKYHVLGGILSAVQGTGPEQLTTQTLLQRIKDGTIHEIIIALTPTLDGQVTMGYLVDLLKSFDGTITTLANGVPLGAELEYIDDGTLSLAFRQRKTA
ncbi:MAG: recombination mediator RecR [Pseudomonadota bacterium]